jgi:hypothetical protein
MRDNPTAGPTAVWQTYRSEPAGYRVEYPAGWTVSEQTLPGGTFLTTFTPADGSGIAVSVQPGEILPANDLPNTRCEQVTIGGLAGTRCLDTLGQSTAITLVGQGKTFTIIAEGKRVEAQILQRLLNTFAPIP